MKTSNHQKGVAALIAMMALLSGSALFLVNEYRTGIRDSRLESLLAAKQALIAYAVNYADNYGHNTRGGAGRLPCPSMVQHGAPARYCQENNIGFLPSVWMRSRRLMEIDYLERFFDQNIWYAVSADHRYNPAYNALNSYPGTGLLSVDSMSEVVAVLISPGQSLDYQNRNNSTGAPPVSVVSEYLELENADLDSDYTFTNKNDLLVPIRRDELVPLMERRVLGFVKQWLIEYKDEHGYYPYASEVGGDGACVDELVRGMIATVVGNCTGETLLDKYYQGIPTGRLLRDTWFTRYDWPELIYYLVDDTCVAGRASVDCDGVDDPERRLRLNGEPVEVILISVGAPIDTLPAAAMQVRTDSDLTQYLDTAALTSAGYEFTTPHRSIGSNDQLVFIN